jgi:hypothetical protein
MAKFLRVGNRVVNLDNIDYVELNSETDGDVIVHFAGEERTVSFGGDDAEEVKTYLTTEQAFQRGFLG